MLAPLSSLFHVLRAMVSFSYRPTGFVEGDLFFRDVPHLGQLEQPNGQPFFKRFSKEDTDNQKSLHFGLVIFRSLPRFIIPRRCICLSFIQPTTIDLDLNWGEFHLVATRICIFWYPHKPLFATGVLSVRILTLYSIIIYIHYIRIL